MDWCNRTGEIDVGKFHAFLLAGTDDEWARGDPPFSSTLTNRQEKIPFFRDSQWFVFAIFLLPLEDLEAVLADAFDRSTEDLLGLFRVLVVVEFKSVLVLVRPRTRHVAFLSTHWRDNGK